MATTAGVVTSDSSTFAQMLAASTPDVRTLAMACRKLIFDVLPETVEVVWAQQRTAGYGTGPKKMSEQFCWLAPAGKHVVFGFYYATELDTPAGWRWEGTGKLMRHIKIRTLDDLRQPHLRDIIAQATTHRVPPPKPSADA